MAAVYIKITIAFFFFAHNFVLFFVYACTSHTNEGKLNWNC